MILTVFFSTSGIPSSLFFLKTVLLLGAECPKSFKKVFHVQCVCLHVCKCAGRKEPWLIVVQLNDASSEKG